VAQVVEHPPSKYKVLSSNPGIKKNNLENTVVTMAMLKAQAAKEKTDLSKF
jgi:hypothetical protein